MLFNNHFLFFFTAAAYDTAPLWRMDSYFSPKKESSLSPVKDGLFTVPKIGPKRGFMCRHCGRILPSRWKLARHERSHTGEKPFVCSICGAAFSCHSYMIVHSKMKHNV